MPCYYLSLKCQNTAFKVAQRDKKQASSSFIPPSFEALYLPYHTGEEGRFAKSSFENKHIHSMSVVGALLVFLS